jgi:hypothetical protein
MRRSSGALALRLRFRPFLRLRSFTFPQQALDTFDGVAVHVEEGCDALEERDVGGAIVAPAPRPFQRAHLRELGLPEAQHVLGHMEVFGDFADRPEGGWRFPDPRTGGGGMPFRRSRFFPRPGFPLLPSPGRRVCSPVHSAPSPPVSAPLISAFSTLLA